MLKFFRENEKIAKWIMVGGLVLLLISWLAFDYSSNSIVSDWLAKGRTWATVGNGDEASAADLQRSQQELAVLGAIGSPILTSLNLKEDPGHWYLLVREANAAGLIGPPADGERLLTARVAGQKDVDPQLLVRQLMGASGLSRNETLQALSNEAGVLRLVSLVGGAGSGRISPARLRQEAARRLLAVSGQVMLIDAATCSVPGSAPLAPPSEKQLEDQLTKYGGLPAGSGEKGFGYQIPSRVRYEWLSIPSASVTAAVERSPLLSNIELRKYFLENEAQFVGANAAIASSKPSFEQYAEAVRAALLAKLTAEKSDEIAKYATDRLSMPLRGLPRKGGYVELPGDWAAQQVPFAVLAKDIAQRFDLTEPTVIPASEAWSSLEEVGAVPGLGAATSSAFGGRGVRPAELVAALKEFGGHATLVAQAGIAFPVFKAPSGDLFIARVTEAQAAHAPTTIAEAREALERDVRRVEIFAILNGQLDAIKQAAGADFAAAASSYSSPTSPFTEVRISNPQFLQYGIEFAQPLPLVGTAAELQDDIVKAAMALPTDKPLADIPASDRTFAFALPNRLSVAVVQINVIAPMNETQLADALKGQGLRGIVGRQGVADPLANFDYPTMRLRHRFVPLAGDKDDAASAESSDATGANGDGAGQS